MDFNQFLNFHGYTPPSQGISPYASSLVGVGGMPNVAPAPMGYWGQRYNQETGRLDSPDAKSTGFLGILTNAKGHPVTEYSVDDNINGRNVSYPTVVPTLSQDQIKAVLSASADETGKTRLPLDVYDAAYSHAKKRIDAGLSPFWNTAQDGWPTR